MTEKGELILKPCLFSHVEKDFKHNARVIKDSGHGGLCRVVCDCGYRSALLGFQEAPLIKAHNEAWEHQQPPPKEQDDEAAFDRWWQSEAERGSFIWQRCPVDEAIKIWKAALEYKASKEVSDD